MMLEAFVCIAFCVIGLGVWVGVFIMNYRDIRRTRRGRRRK